MLCGGCCHRVVDVCVGRHLYRGAEVIIRDVICNAGGAWPVDDI